MTDPGLTDSLLMGADLMAAGRPWLLLDLAGVLLRFRPDRRERRLRELSGLDEAALRARLADTPIGDRLDDGSASEGDLAAFLTRLAGRHVDIDEAWAIWLTPFTPDSRAFYPLAGLVNSFRLGVFTNNSRAVTRVFDDSPFERLFFSAEIGVRKPDPDSFRRVTLLLDTEPGNILFVDDMAANVDAARAAGWRAALFRDGDDLEEVVRSAQLG